MKDTLSYPLGPMVWIQVTPDALPWERNKAIMGKALCSDDFCCHVNYINLLHHLVVGSAILF